MALLSNPEHGRALVHRYFGGVFRSLPLVSSLCMCRVRGLLCLDAVQPPLRSGGPSEPLLALVPLHLAQLSVQTIGDGHDHLIDLHVLLFGRALRDRGLALDGAPRRPRELRFWWRVGEGLFGYIFVRNARGRRAHAHERERGRLDHGDGLGPQTPRERGHVLWSGKLVKYA